MYVDEERIVELKEQVANIQKQIKLLSVPTQMACYCKKQPVGGGIWRDEKGGVVSDRYNTDVWNHFKEIGKMLFQEKTTVREELRSTWCCVEKEMYRNSHTGKRPQKVSQLTHEELEIAGRMLDEMIDIYNRYYEALHPTATYIDLNGNVSEVPVKYFGEKEIQR